MKWDPKVIARRFKVQHAAMIEEFDWEMEVLLLLEEDVFPYLQAQEIPTDQWEYYVAFAKRMWERRVHFNQLTFLLEKTSLLNEFTLRGLNPVHLNAIQVFAEDWAEKKLIGPVPPVPPPKGWLIEADQLVYGEPWFEAGMLIYGETAGWLWEVGVTTYGETWWEGGMLVEA